MNDRTVVVLVPLDTYEQEQVNKAVKTGIELLGGLGRFLSKDEKILLKPNLLCSAEPQRAATTHPAVLSAAASLFLSEGYSRLEYGDSPGSPLTSA